MDRQQKSKKQSNNKVSEEMLEQYGEEVWDVDSIIGKKIKDNEVYYKVKWSGQKYKPTWEPRSNLMRFISSVILSFDHEQELINQKKIQKKIIKIGANPILLPNQKNQENKSQVKQSYNNKESNKQKNQVFSDSDSNSDSSSSVSSNLPPNQQILQNKLQDKQQYIDELNNKKNQDQKDINQNQICDQDSKIQLQNITSQDHLKQNKFSRIMSVSKSQIYNDQQQQQVQQKNRLIKNKNNIKTTKNNINSDSDSDDLSLDFIDEYRFEKIQYIMTNQNQEKIQYMVRFHCDYGHNFIDKVISEKSMKKNYKEQFKKFMDDKEMEQNEEIYYNLQNFKLKNIVKSDKKIESKLFFHVFWENEGINQENQEIEYQIIKNFQPQILLKYFENEYEKKRQYLTLTCNQDNKIIVNQKMDVEENNEDEKHIDLNQSPKINLQINDNQNIVNQFDNQEVIIEQFQSLN